MASSPSSKPKDLRPLSPHLSIYRPQISSVLSILHRATGVVLSGGLLLLALWLWSAAYNPGFYTTLHEWMGGIIGRILMVGWTFSFYYHLCNGIRHLFWDIGQGYTIPVMHKSGWAVIIVTLALTALTWGMVLGG